MLIDMSFSINVINISFDNDDDDDDDDNNNNFIAFEYA